MPVRYYRQKNDYYCGPACLKMALSHFGINKSQDALAKIAKTNSRIGTIKSMLVKTLAHNGIIAHKRSYLTIKDLRRLQTTHIILVNYPELEEDINHYAIIRSIQQKRIIFFDPWYGATHAVPLHIFMRRWKGITKGKKYSAFAVLIPKKQSS